MLRAVCELCRGELEAEENGQLDENRAYLGARRDFN